MGIVGEYLDQLTDVQRDRVIEATGWCWQFSYDDCHCLVGHAEAYVEHKATDPAYGEDGQLLCISSDRMGWLVYDKVPELFDRFGKDRIIRACKARAARGNQPTVHEIRDEIYKGLTVRAVMEWRERAAGELVSEGGMYGSTLLEES